MWDSTILTESSISEDIVGMLLVIACQFYELDDLLGSLARQRLPEASH